MRRTVPEERRGSGADQVPAGALLDPDHRALPGLGAGYRDRGERQSWSLVQIVNASRDFAAVYSEIAEVRLLKAVLRERRSFLVLHLPRST
jgi:hypothetical protein